MPSMLSATIATGGVSSGENGMFVAVVDTPKALEAGVRYTIELAQTSQQSHWVVGTDFVLEVSL